MGSLVSTPRQESGEGKMSLKHEYYKELFKEIDQEKDGEIYLKEVVLYLRALNQDMESLEVKHLLDQYELRGMEVLDFSEFLDIMEQLESVGWVRVEKKESFEMTELDVDEIFKMIDMDKSGAISRSEARVAFKLLSKRFGIKDVGSWMRQTDKNNDGKLTRKEFYQSVMA